MKAWSDERCQELRRLVLSRFGAELTREEFENTMIRAAVDEARREQQIEDASKAIDPNHDLCPGAPYACHVTISAAILARSEVPR